MPTAELLPQQQLNSYNVAQLQFSLYVILFPPLVNLFCLIFFFSSEKDAEPILFNSM